MVLAFVALGTIYKDATPIFETAEEAWHYAYVKRLADGEGLPPLRISDDAWEQGEAHQPPLYYALGALLTRDIDTGAADALYERNPYAALGDPRSSGNKNAVLHLGDEARPYRGAAQAVDRLRSFSILCSALTLLLAYWLAVETVPRDRAGATATAILVGLNPQFLFVSASASNNALAILLVTLALYLATRIANGKWHPYLTPVALGVSVGLASLTESAGLASVVLIPCALAGQARGQSRRLWQDLARPILLALAVAAATGGWWYARNAILYQDALGLQAVLGARGILEGPLPLYRALLLLGDASNAYWGLFGWMNVPCSEAFYALSRIISALGAVGMLLALGWSCWRRRRLPLRGQRRALPVVCCVLISIAHLVWWIRLTGRPRGQILFPAISGISLLLSVGLTGWFPRRYFGIPVFGLSVLLLAFSLVTPYRYIAPAYERPERIALEEVPANIQDLNVSFGDALFLLGYELHQDSVKAGDALGLRLYWLGRKVMRQNYAFHLCVFGREGQPIGVLDTYPGLGSYPTRLWLLGDVVCDDYLIVIDESAQGPTAGAVRVGVSTGPGTGMLPAVDAHGVAIGRDCPISQVRVAPAREVLYQPQRDLQVNLGRKAMLSGYDLVPRTPTAGDVWEINLYWKALVRMSNDYTVFIHLINNAGEMVAQVDEQPMSGSYPTHLWQLDEQVKDPHHLALPNDLPLGEYSLETGLYLLDAGERLPVVGADPPATAVTLGPVQILAR